MAVVATTTVEETYRRLRELIGDQHSDEELRHKAALAVEVNRL